MEPFLTQQPREVCKAICAIPFVSLILKRRAIFQENMRELILEEENLAVFFF